MAEKVVLIVDEDEKRRDSLASTLTMEGFSVTTVPDLGSSVKSIEKGGIDFVLSQLREDGTDLSKAIKDGGDGRAALVLLVEGGTVDETVGAMRSGASGVIETSKEGWDKELVAMLNDRALTGGASGGSGSASGGGSLGCADDIFGVSAEIADVRTMIERVADSDTTVLILGESGTGKELVARALHKGSSRSGRPFVSLNCGAIPEELLESELFGYEKGAFTGAIATRKGRFEVADGGTVFLDEIGDMSPSLQVKILRALQESTFERVGGNETIKVDIRVIAATHQDLEKAVEERRFREDLFYRLNVIPIHLPPLRLRSNDIPLLAEHFLGLFTREKGRDIKEILPDAMQIMSSYKWPGNIRELENLLERLVVLADGDMITVDDLPEKIKGRSEDIEELKESLAYEHPFATDAADDAVFNYSVPMPPEGIDYNDVVDLFERELIESALKNVKGVKKKAAEYLKLNRTTLIEKMKRKGLLDQK